MTEDSGVKYSKGLPTKDEDCTEFILSVSLYLWLPATENLFLSCLIIEYVIKDFI